MATATRRKLIEPTQYARTWRGKTHSVPRSRKYLPGRILPNRRRQPTAQPPRRPPPPRRSLVDSHSSRRAHPAACSPITIHACASSSATRLQFGRRDSVRLERVDLAAWSKEFLTEFWQTEDIDAEILRLNAPRESVPVRADPAHLHKLLWTLCTDLLKYGRASNATDPVEIRVGSQHHDPASLSRRDRSWLRGWAGGFQARVRTIPGGRQGGHGHSMFVSRELSPRVRSGANNDPRPGGGVVFRLVFAESPAPKPVDPVE